MTEPTAFNLTDAALPDGTVDFYTLIGKTPDADSEDIRLRIQALYSEATANRDNRNLKKRREYQTLLELLPPARAALLEAPKRARYDEFLAKAKNGSAPSDFETFINDLMGFNDQMEEKTGLLATKDKVEPRASVIKTTDAPTPASKPTPAARPAPAARPTSASGPAATSSRSGSTGSSSGNAYTTGGAPKSSSGGPGGIIGGVGGLLIGAVLAYVALHNIIPAILAGIIFGAVGFVLLNGKVGNKISQ